MLLFDFDGTLAQSLELVYTIYNRIAPEYNLLQMDEEDEGFWQQENRRM